MDEENLEISELLTTEISLNNNTEAEENSLAHSESFAANPLKSCVNSALRKKKFSKDQHVHFTFDDFHCYSSLEETQVSNTHPYPRLLSETRNPEDDASNVDDSSTRPSRRQCFVLIIFTLAQATSAMLISLQAPLFPAEAQRKGATATEFGFVFGIFELTVMLASPVWGKYMEKVGPKLVFNFGLFVTGTCAILFGFFDGIDNRTIFILSSVLVIIIAAFGDAAILTASYTIIVSEFNDSINTAFLMKEGMFGLGLILGPVIGCLLYQLGGYIFSYLVLGSVQLLVALLTLLVLPNTGHPSGGFRSELSYKIITILKIPSIGMAAMSIFGAAFSTGYLSALLEPHIRQFALTPILTGVVFMISSGSYAISSPFWSWICDRVLSSKHVSLIGTFLILIGFLLIGPAPFFPFESELEITLIGLAIHGVGLGASLVASFRYALKQTLKSNFPDNIETYGLVSGLWALFFSLGNAISPIAGGALFDSVGFRLGCWAILALQLIVLFVTYGFLKCCTKPRIRNGRADKSGMEWTEHDLLLSIG